MTLTVPPGPTPADIDPAPAPVPDLARRSGRHYDPVAVSVVAVVTLVLGLFSAFVFVAMRTPPARPAQQLTVRLLVPAGEPLQGDRPAAVVAPPAAQQQWHIGDWTPERGRQIAQRALHWLGWPYSFAGGSAQGPTYGVAVDAASRNDGSVRGFDCSGLVLYALAPWLHVDHLASAQYSQTGSVHPSLPSLLPGDLIFWSTDGTIAKVHHVAVYVGDGNVVQAPESGSQVKITPLDQVGGGVIGTVRPLT